MKAQNSIVVSQSLNSREQSIVSIAALTAFGNVKQLKNQLNNGLISMIAECQSLFFTVIRMKLYITIRQLN